MLDIHWGISPRASVLRPLRPAAGRPLSHTSGLWRVSVSGEPGRGGGEFVLKAQLTAEALRPVAFHVIKRQVMEVCARQGIPVAVAVPALDGAPAVLRDGIGCELLPLLPGTAHQAVTPARAREIVAAGLGLRSVLDGLPEQVVRALAPYPVDPLVAQPCWRAALEDALGRLGPMAARRPDGWGRLVSGALRELERAGPLLERLTEAGEQAAGGTAVVHGDLHHRHFLFGEADRHRITGVLDFDNLRVDDRLLDLAWTAASAGRVAGGRAARREGARAFVRAAEGAGLLAPGEAGLLMPRLLAYAVPIVVDIAQDVLERDILDDLWAEYLDLLSPARMADTHALLTQ
ncbi:phosphotransferase [Streptomyces diacarni]|uniref:phosphotransferase enzyme family protein n=1 Tax=Streptomyces diacarni TaxID=2800381 RepID=UPI003407E82F